MHWSLDPHSSTVILSLAAPPLLLAKALLFLLLSLTSCAAEPPARALNIDFSQLQAELAKMKLSPGVEPTPADLDVIMKRLQKQQETQRVGQEGGGGERPTGFDQERYEKLVKTQGGHVDKETSPLVSVSR